MNELIAAAKAVIESVSSQWQKYGAIVNIAEINRLSVAVERAEKQESVGFDEWTEATPWIEWTTQNAWTAAQQAERERIRAIVKEMMVDDTWVFGDSLLERIDGD